VKCKNSSLLELLPAIPTLGLRFFHAPPYVCTPCRRPAVTAETPAQPHQAAGRLQRHRRLPAHAQPVLANTRGGPPRWNAQPEHYNGADGGGGGAQPGPVAGRGGAGGSQGTSQLHSKALLSCIPVNTHVHTRACLRVCLSVGLLLVRVFVFLEYQACARVCVLCVQWS